MELEQIYELMGRFQASGLTRLEWTRKDESLVLCREIAVSPAASAPVMAASAPAEQPAPQDKVPEGELVTAPLVGTFYAASQPGAEPFVTAGRQVKKGETLCLIEAMKMMSEIPATADCVVEEIMVDDGSAVGYGQPLLRVRRV